MNRKSKKLGATWSTKRYATDPLLICALVFSRCSLTFLPLLLACMMNRFAHSTAKSLARYRFLFLFANSIERGAVLTILFKADVSFNALYALSIRAYRNASRRKAHEWIRKRVIMNSCRIERGKYSEVDAPKLTVTNTTHTPPFFPLARKRIERSQWEIEQSHNQTGGKITLPHISRNFLTNSFHSAGSPLSRNQLAPASPP